MSAEIGAVVSQAAFIIIALVVGGLVAAQRKRQQQREAEETQAQLRRVDEAIRQARQRAGTGRVAGPAAAYVVASPAFRSGAQGTATGSVPFAIPVEDPEGPNRPGAWDKEHAAKPKEKKRRPVAAVSEGFAPPTEAELREAMMWREVMAPCLALRH